MTRNGQARVLIVEDEESLADSIRYNLERDGFITDVATDGRQGLERFRIGEPDLVLLDLMLPEVSGLDVARTIRTESSVPVIMLTAKDAEADRVTGLELGADDYVTKPFSMRELVSRVRANLRRAQMNRVDSNVDEVLEGGPVRLDISRHEAIGSRRADPVPAEGVRAAGDVPPAQGAAAHPRPPDRRGMGVRLLRRHQDPGRARETDPEEDRGRPARAGPSGDGSRARLQVRRLGGWGR